MSTRCRVGFDRALGLTSPLSVRGGGGRRTGRSDRTVGPPASMDGTEAFGDVVRDSHYVVYASCSSTIAVVASPARRSMRRCRMYQPWNALEAPRFHSRARTRVFRR